MFKKCNFDFKKKFIKLLFVLYICMCRCNLWYYILLKKEYFLIICWVELNINLKLKLYKGILKIKLKLIYILIWMNVKMGW